MLSFKLSDDFVAEYENVPTPFGFKDAGGNSLGEITFIRTYSRKKQDGTKETWPEVCRRVIEGMYSIQKNHCKANRLPWHDNKAHASAQEAFDRLFNLKWCPPGRGLWVMGTPLVNELNNSAPLQNCAFVSTGEMTKHNPAKPFMFFMEALMLGVGVGFDNKGADKEFQIYEPTQPWTYTIPDSREGWAMALGKLINSYLKPMQPYIEFDYTEVRPYGSPIKTFGGTASGPEPLRNMLEGIRKVFANRAGSMLTRTDIADIGNLIGVCVVAGNVRRSAELLMGAIDDKEFINLKNPAYFPERNSFPGGWSWMSNNSVEAKVGDNFDHIVEGIMQNGEPGVIWMDTTRKYGRLKDQANNKDWRAAGYNPCAEQSLESQEMCTLVETFINRAESLDDFKRTLKFAFLYAKTVTLLPTHWAETNAIMQRNRRIGTSISGIANFTDNKGLPMLRKWVDEGYDTVRRYDTTYSEWLGVRESIKVTTVKPSGTVSILAGESPGVHWSPGGEYFMRTIRFAKDDPIVPLLQYSRYRVDPSISDPDNTMVAYFPVHAPARRSEKDVSIFEKAALAATMQRYWSDNSVSVTISFDSEHEAKHVGTVLHMYDGQLKTASFLPMGNDVYEQQPYTHITADEYEQYTYELLPIDFSLLYDGESADAIGERYCSNDTCTI